MSANGRVAFYLGRIPDKDGDPAGTCFRVVRADPLAGADGFEAVVDRICVPAYARQQLAPPLPGLQHLQRQRRVSVANGQAAGAARSPIQQVRDEAR
jgi:hypothetical protein